MKCLLLAAGRFDDALAKEIDSGREPRLDVFELARKLDADLLDFEDVVRSRQPAVRLLSRTVSKSAALALLGFQERGRYDAVFTTGEDIGLPLAALLSPTRARCSHTMIAHTLRPKKKQVFFKARPVTERIDCMLVYATIEERLATDELGVPKERVRRIAYHADELFFRGDGRALESDLICAAGQLLRDYDTLVDAVRELPVRVQIAAGSPWIDETLRPRAELPKNVSWGKLNRHELRELYARSALAVVPIFENDYQTGIATILEMMAMGKCVIATRTRGQTDTIVDGETGVYVPPGDPRALRAAIERMLQNPEEAARIGRGARRYIEERAGLDLFVTKVSEAIHAGNEARRGR